MLCGFGTDFVGGRLPFVLHPAVLPKLQSIAQRLGLPTPTGAEPPLPVGGAQQQQQSTSSPQQITSPPQPSFPPLIGIEPLLLSAMFSTLQQSMEQPQSQQQPQQVNPAAKAFFTLLMQQHAAIRNSLLPSLSLVEVNANNNNNNSVSPTNNQPGNEPMDFSPVIAEDHQPQLPSMTHHLHQGTSNGSSEVSPADLTTARASKSSARTGSSFMAPSSSSSPVDAEALVKNQHHHERTPHRRVASGSGGGNSNFDNSATAGMIVHGEPIECLPAYAKLANSRWSHKQALQRQQQNSSLNNSDDMTVGPSPNNNNNACSPTSACMHVCIFCGKRYSRKYGLKIHLRTHTGYRPLECRYCHRRFGDPSNLNKHLRLHAQVESPFVCKFCGKSLVRRRDLDRHLRSRHPNMMATAGPPGAPGSASTSTALPSTASPAALMTPVSLSATPSSRSQQQQQPPHRNARVGQIITANTMVFPSRGVSPLSNNSPTNGASHSH